MRPIFKFAKLQKTINGKVFQVEKIISFIRVDKDWIIHSDICLSTYLTKSFWDAFSYLILQSKALPLPDPTIMVTYAWDLNNDRNFIVRMSVTALRLRTVGRRSNQFKSDQTMKLAIYKQNYIKMLDTQIEASSILQAAKHTYSWDAPG